MPGLSWHNLAGSLFPSLGYMAAVERNWEAPAEGRIAGEQAPRVAADAVVGSRMVSSPSARGELVSRMSPGWAVARAMTAGR